MMMTSARARRMRRPKRAEYTLQGGPLDGRHVWLEAGSTCTAPLALHGQAGQYRLDRLAGERHVLRWEAQV